MRSVLALAMVVATPALASTPHKKPAKHVVAKKVASKKAASRKSKKKGMVMRVPSKPSVAVASHHGDGRVRYGKDNLPPGFAWPATPAMKAASNACEQSLADASIAFEAAPPEGYITDPIHVPAMEVAGIQLVRAYGKGPVTFDCQLILALHKIGPELRQLGVREIRFGSVYRNSLVRVHGETKPILSRHALGLAMDIKSFVDDKGRVADVELDYLKGDELLHAIEDTVNRSTDFRIVLTPGNDPLSHSDHFHIEASVDFTAFR